MCRNIIIMVSLRWQCLGRPTCRLQVLYGTPPPHAAHPSPLSATRFFGCKVFSKTNEALEKCGKQAIDWQV